MRCKEYAILVAALFPVAAAPFSAAAVGAITDNWTDGTGNWSTPANWSANLAPAAGDTVNIAFLQRVSSHHHHLRLHRLQHHPVVLLTIDLSGVAFSNAILTQAANNLAATTETIGAGSISPSDGAVFNQSGGTNTTATLFFGSTTNGKGSYNLSGSGTLTDTATEYLGYNGSGTFTQNGGTHIINGGGNSFFIGYNPSAVGSYTLSAGSLAVTGFEIIGYLGTGSMNQSGGTHTVAAGYYFSLGSGGGSGAYTLSGTGSLVSNSSEYIGSNGSGTFTQNGGTNTITPGNFLVIANLPGSAGNYTLTAGTATINGSAYVGGGNTTAGGTGLLNIQGGAMTIAGTLKIWNTPNSFVNLSGGSLTINALDTSANPAHFNWTAGALTLNNDLLQNNTAASTFPNSFALNANQSLSVQNAYIGDTGVGIFTQNGGALTVNNSNGLVIGGRTAADSSAVGTYNFNGGTFTNTSNIPILVGNFGHGTFNQTTGSLNLIALFVGYQAGAIGTVNQSGGSLTSTNSLILGFSGTGSYNLSTGNLSTNDATLGFDVTGSGTMTQTGGNFSVQTNLQLAFSPGTTALYTLSAGSLTVPGTLSVGISGAATFTQTGGTLTVANQNGLVITRNAGSTGNYTLSGTGVATFNGNASVGGDMFNPGANGLLNIQGGAMTVVGTLKVWNTANTSLNLSGGSLTVGALDTNANPARFHWTAGSLTIDNYLFFDTIAAVAVPFGNSLTLNASQSLTLTSNGNHFEYLGTPGSTLIQNGGNNTAPSLFVGNNPGPGTPATYTLNAGNLTIANYEEIGAQNPVIGIFNQTGGTNSTSALVLGDTPSSTGTFNLSGGNVTVSNTASLGSTTGLPGGAGILNIQGGAMTVFLFNLYDSPGTAVNLTGGSLSVNILNTFGNPSRFSWTGGTLNLISLLIDSSGPLGTSLTLTPGKILNNAATLTNNGALTLAGGSVSSTGPILNNTSLSGFGTIAGSAGITNNGLLTHSGGNLPITNTGLFTNNANMQLAPGFQLQLTGGNLSNFAFLDLPGAAVTGTATLINNPSGTLAGSAPSSPPSPTRASSLSTPATSNSPPSPTTAPSKSLAPPPASALPEPSPTPPTSKVTEKWPWPSSTTPPSKPPPEISSLPEPSPTPPPAPSAPPSETRSSSNPPPPSPTPASSTSPAEPSTPPTNPSTTPARSPATASSPPAVGGDSPTTAPSPSPAAPPPSTALSPTPPAKPSSPKTSPPSSPETSPTSAPSKPPPPPSPSPPTTPETPTSPIPPPTSSRPTPPPSPAAS